MVRPAGQYIPGLMLMPLSGNNIECTLLESIELLEGVTRPFDSFVSVVNADTCGFWWSAYMYNTGFLRVRNMTLEVEGLGPESWQVPCDNLAIFNYTLSRWQSAGCYGTIKYTEDMLVGGPRDFNITLRGWTSKGQLVQASRQLRMSPTVYVSAGISIYNTACRLKEGKCAFTACQASCTLCFQISCKPLRAQPQPP